MLKKIKFITAITVVFLMARPKCKSDDKDEGKRDTLAKITHGSFKTRPQNSEVGIYVISM